MLDITPTQGFPHMYDFIGNTMAKGANPIVLIIFTAVIMLYYLLFSYLGVGGAPGAGPQPPSPGVTFIEALMWGMFIFLVLINGLQYFFKVDIRAGIRHLFSPVPEVDISVITPPEEDEEEVRGADDTEFTGGSVPEILGQPQVFHVPDNIYRYRDAKAVCKAYGAKLANYSQLEDAYKDGAEWCGFGWSDGQMALYPTQKDTWKGLQKIKGHRHDCGRPGVNGGFIDNPKVRFGINCYGYKPKITPLERELMENESPFPVTRRELEFQKKVDHYRSILPDVLVSPFNYENWSQV